MGFTQELGAIQQPLLDWFRANRRDLPWRKNYEPYQVWISEIMLQQTQVKTVLPYFERWMQRFPCVEDLAKADLQDVLKLWEGLGYYSRARNLHKASKMIVEEFGGHLPREVDELLKIPGIGPYTAGAIASIAFEEDAPVLDGNVIRVLSRLADFEGVVNSNKPAFWEAAEYVIPSGEARDFNQGMMEFGALMCTPKKPSCDTCPLRSECRAYERGTVLERPVKVVRKKTEKIQVAVGILFDEEGRVYVQRRPEKGLMGGLWEFPGGKVEAGESIEDALRRELKEEMGVSVENVEDFMRLKHAYTRFQVDLRAYTARVSANSMVNTELEHKWVKSEDLKDLPFPAANVRLIKRLTG